MLRVLLLHSCNNMPTVHVGDVGVFALITSQSQSIGPCLYIKLSLCLLAIVPTRYFFFCVGARIRKGVRQFLLASAQLASSADYCQ